MMQWNLSNLDTNGTEGNAHISEEGLVSPRLRVIAVGLCVLVSFRFEPTVARVMHFQVLFIRECQPAPKWRKLSNKAFLGIN